MVNTQPPKKANTTEMAALKESLKKIIEKLKDLKPKITTEVLAEGQTSLKTELDTLNEECTVAHTAAYAGLGASDLASYTAIAYVQTSVFVVFLVHQIDSLITAARESSDQFQSSYNKSSIKTILGHETKSTKQDVEKHIDKVIERVNKSQKRIAKVGY